MKRLSTIAIIAATSFLAAEESNTKSLTIGGYGELHLNKTIVDDETVATPAVLDFHRFVLLLDKKFNDKWSFTGELELEHNAVQDGQKGVAASIDSTGKKVTVTFPGKDGYLVLEQAFLQYQPVKEFGVRAGVMLYPIGLINENHEPAYFSTVERPAYHNEIIPTTWFGSGIAVGGTVANALRYDVMVTEGLNDRKFDAAGKEGLREARQKGFYSQLDNVLSTVRLDYIGLPGLKAGGSYSLNAVTNDDKKDHKYDQAHIVDLHAQYNGNGFRSSVEFAHVSYNAITEPDAKGVARAGKLENSQGITAELGYNVAKIWDAEELALYPFARYSKLNRAGKISDDAAKTRIEGGLALHPLKPLAVKVTVGRELYTGATKNVTTIDAGIGYDF